ncbi:MAG: peroxide stress protein YaaA [Microbacterium sp.]|uniref:YaaA family protein n=1 Tax=Microbacterium sp. TaxID=51671 RepID=UPI0039E44307
MLILLPPSETKRSGGTGAPLRTDTLALPQLAGRRDAVVDALVALSADADAAARVLGLSARQRPEVEVNAALRTAATLPAMDRYTGVLYDALDAVTLDARARRWLGEHALIHSAPFGPVGARDPIPAYRLAAGTSLPGLPALRRHWAEAVTAALTALAPAFVLDLRSEAYAALGPVPTGIPSAYVRVVADAGGGAVRALNHFNKRTKGLLARELAEMRPRVRTLRGLRDWLRGSGHRLDEVNGEWLLHAAGD